MSEHGRLVDATTLEFRRTLDVDIETLWAFFTNPEKRQKWFCAGETDDFVGGRMVFDFDHRKLSKGPPPEKYADEEQATFEGTILEYDPPHRLAFDWPESGGTDRTKVEITLTAIDDRTTELVLVHSGLDNRDYLIGAMAGWHAHFDLLADVFAGGEVRDFWPHHMVLEEEYAARIGS